ncbi:hypothetical protein [Streptomyces sp. Ru62]|uniref:hypothetical protein n=1 Tax=Streptomyces sp. Ru62 TaxID=2080745 RepID=UPI00215623C4|nr:hypothetical protein [Streptomyces sp. Ru62]
MPAVASSPVPAALENLRPLDNGRFADLRVHLCRPSPAPPYNETRHFRPLLAPLELAGTIVTFDAPHSVKATIARLVTAKKNRRTLRKVRANSVRATHLLHALLVLTNLEVNR